MYPMKIKKWPRSHMTSHQGNANQSHSEIILYTHQSDCEEKKQIITSIDKDWRHWRLIQGWWECKMEQLLWNLKPEVSGVTSCVCVCVCVCVSVCVCVCVTLCSTMDSSNSPPKHIHRRNENICPHKNRHQCSELQGL